MTTSNHTAPAVRTLSENDLQIITKAYTSLHSVLKDYITGEDPLPEHFNPRSEKVQQIVAARAMHALKVVADAQRKAERAEVGAKITSTISPFIVAGRTAYDSLVALKTTSPQAYDMVVKSGALKDYVRVPLTVVATAFKSGTTFDHIKTVCESLGYKVAKGADKGSFDLIVALVAKEGPKPVPNAQLARRATREEQEENSAEGAQETTSEQTSA